MEELKERHKQEKKQLTATIQALKNSVNRNDKKRKKEINSEIAKMEADLLAKHTAELKNFDEATNVDTSSETSTDVQGDVASLNGTTKNLSLGDSCEDGQDATAPVFRYEVRQLTKAQRKKEKRKEAQKLKASQYEDEDVSHLNYSKEQEASKLAEILKEKQLAIHEIASDGDCLYNSIVHQLSLQGIESSVNDLRSKAAEYIKSHKSRFGAFLVDEASGNVMSSDDIDNYCEKVANTSVWGGQVELQALAESLAKPVEVLQAEGQPIQFGSEFREPKIHLCYLKHAYSLGEHYNSLVPA